MASLVKENANLSKVWYSCWCQTENAISSLVCYCHSFIMRRNCRLEQQKYFMAQELISGFVCADDTAVLNDRSNMQGTARDCSTSQINQVKYCEKYIQ